MSERSVETLEHGIIGTHERVGERVGWLAVTESFEDDGETRRGTLVELSVATIAGDYVEIKDKVFLEDGEEVNKYREVEGIAEPHMGAAWLDSDNRRQDWNGEGFYKGYNSYPSGWSPFRAAWPYKSKDILESGRWAVGDKAILDELRSEIESKSETPEQAQQIYGTIYVRFNRLLADSYTNQLKEGKIKPRPLSEVLVIDPEITQFMETELQKAQDYASFTLNHLSIDGKWESKIASGIPFADLEQATSEFIADRENIATSHEEVIQKCQEMLDSIYVPSGFRIGAGRTWPYMDVHDFKNEAEALRNGNLHRVHDELKREIAELDYKHRVFITPHVLVLRALSGDTNITIYG